MGIKAAEIAYSLGTWAAELGLTRDVLRRMLSEAGIVALGRRPTYRARDVFAAVAKDSSTDDPDSLKPMERRAHYQAEHEKLRLQVERAELVPAIEVEQTLGLVTKLVARAYDTATDNLERDVGVSPIQAEYLERHFDGCREQLYRQLSADEDDADSTAALSA